MSNLATVSQNGAPHGVQPIKVIAVTGTDFLLVIHSKCWWIGPAGESPAGETTTSPDSDWQVSERKTNPQCAGDDGHVGAGIECDWTRRRKYRGKFVAGNGSCCLQRRMFIPVRVYILQINVYITPRLFAIVKVTPQVKQQARALGEP